MAAKHTNVALRGTVGKTAVYGLSFLQGQKGDASPMSKNLRRAFVKARPIAQTIATVVSAIAAILRIAKSLGF